MHARKQTQQLTKPTRPTPRILNADEAVPALHRTIVEGAMQRIELALQELDAVLHTYNARDPRVYDLRTQVATRLQMTLIVGDQWLTWHPAAPEVGQ